MMPITSTGRVMVSARTIQSWILKVVQSVRSEMSTGVSARTIQSWILKGASSRLQRDPTRRFSEDEPVGGTERSVPSHTTGSGTGFSEDDPVVDTESYFRTQFTAIR